MTKKKMPCFPLEYLQDMIESPAKELGWDSPTLFRHLAAISMEYMEVVEQYQMSATRGEILRSLSEVLERPDQKLADAIAILRLEAIDAMIGRFPTAFARYKDVEGNNHLAWITNDEAVIRAAFKNRMARQSRLNKPNMVKLERHRTGLESVYFQDEESVRSHLRDIAKTDPAAMRRFLRHTIDILTDVFQFGDSRGGRNTKVLDGIRANADWRLFNLVLDVIWPIERGELHSTKMGPVKDILHGVLIYIWGDKPKRGKGNKISEKMEGVQNGDNGLAFDNNLFSNVLTLRHQINSLSCALEISERKFMEIERSRGACHDAGTRLNALDRLVIYPLRDWKNELERRLAFGDYRPHDPRIRRPTGDLLLTPRMPKFRKVATQYERLHALIEAASPLVKGEQCTDDEKCFLTSVFSTI